MKSAVAKYYQLFLGHGLKPLDIEFMRTIQANHIIFYVCILRLGKTRMVFVSGRTTKVREPPPPLDLSGL